MEMRGLTRQFVPDPVFRELLQGVADSLDLDVYGFRNTDQDKPELRS